MKNIKLKFGKNFMNIFLVVPLKLNLFLMICLFVLTFIIIITEVYNINILYFIGMIIGVYNINILYFIIYIISFFYVFYEWKIYLNKMILENEIDEIFSSIFLSISYYLIVFLVLFGMSGFRHFKFREDIFSILSLPYLFLNLLTLSVNYYVVVLVQIILHIAIFLATFLSIKKQIPDYVLLINGKNIFRKIFLLCLIFAMFFQNNKKNNLVISGKIENIEIVSEYQYKEFYYSDRIVPDFFKLKENLVFKDILISELGIDCLNIDFLGEFPETLLKLSLENAINGRYSQYDIKKINDNNLFATENNYKKLLENEFKEVLIGIEPPEEYIKMAKEKNIELSVTPIAREALVFYVNKINPINTLTIEQVEDIYSGDIKNWIKVNGFNKNIMAFQRNGGTESQILMEQKVMKRKKLKEPIYHEINNELIVMTFTKENIADYHNFKNAIGYSLRYYPTYYNEVNNLKLLSINDVEPTKENIEKNIYPLSVDICLITIDNDDENIKKLIKWFMTDEGQNVIEELGFVKKY